MDGDAVKVQDESLWQQQLAQMAEDTDPKSAAIKDFMIAWADSAEDYLDGLAKYHAPADEPKRTESWKKLTALDALRARLQHIENRFGAISTGFLGMILVLLSNHWAYGELIYDQMTEIEKNIYRSIAVLKVAQLQAQAESAGNG